MTFQKGFQALPKTQGAELRENDLVKCTMTVFAPQVAQPQELTRSTSGPHRGPSVVPPGHPHLRKPFAGHIEVLRRLRVPEVVGTEAESL